jgi:hypothetical protein
MDALLWIDPDPDSLKDAAQLDAILEYVACGGRLVVALTPGSKLGAASPLARAIPAAASGHDDVPADEVLAALTGGSATAAGKAPVPVARLSAVTGRVAAKLPDGRPLLVRASYGLGTMTAAAFDPRLLRKAGALGHARLLHALFGEAVAQRSQEQYPGQLARGASMEPLVNHLRKRFLSAPPLGLLVLGLALYVAAIGPVDYFILKRKGKLRRTVVTFPLIVVSFTLLAYGASFLLFGGSSGQARVAWIDLATSPRGDADVVRGLDISGAYSPTGTTLEMAYDQPRSFMGAPWLGGGTGYGPGDAGSLDGSVEIGPDGRPSASFDLPLRSHRTIQARFSGDVPQSLDASVRTEGASRTLTVRNGLRLVVHDLCIVRGRKVCYPGELAAGGRLDVPLEGKGWQNLGGGPLLPDPFDQGSGMFSESGYGPSGGSGQFVPADESERENAGARERMARAAMGATLSGILSPPASGRTRVLARQGLDLSAQALEGRILVMGWCEGDPLGGLPAWRDLRSSAVVVRRLLPAEEGK